MLVAAVGGFWLCARSTRPAAPARPSPWPSPPGTQRVGDRRTSWSQNGVVTSARVFRYYLKFKGEGSDFQAGEYELRENMAMGTCVTALERGPEVAYSRLTIPRA